MSSWQQAVIERIVVQTPRVKSFFLNTPIERHVAGQHLDVRLTAEDGYAAQRAYSIASAPGSTIELAIEELAEGEVSPYFHEVAQVGDTVEVRGPLGGHFVWSAHEGGPVLHQHIQRGALQRQGQFLAAGVGAGQADVAFDRVVEQVGVLRHQPAPRVRANRPAEARAGPCHRCARFLAGVPEAQHPPISLRS